MADRDSHDKVLVLDQPCAHCQVLNLDDEKQGGQIRQSDNGPSFVSFEFADGAQAAKAQGSRVRETWNSMLTCLGAVAFRRPLVKRKTRTRLNSDGWELDLGYRRKDILPNLPGFSSTASRGCAFCQILREDIVALGRNEEARIPNRHGLAEKTHVIVTEVKYCFRSPWFTEGRVALDSLCVLVLIGDDMAMSPSQLHYDFQTEASGMPTETFFSLFFALP